MKEQQYAIKTPKGYIIWSEGTPTTFTPNLSEASAWSKTTAKENMARISSFEIELVKAGGPITRCIMKLSFCPHTSAFIMKPVDNRGNALASGVSCFTADQIKTTLDSFKAQGFIFTNV